MVNEDVDDYSYSKIKEIKRLLMKNVRLTVFNNAWFPNFT